MASASHAEAASNPTCRGGGISAEAVAVVTQWRFGLVQRPQYQRRHVLDEDATPRNHGWRPRRAVGQLVAFDDIESRAAAPRDHQLAVVLQTEQQIPALTMAACVACRPADVHNVVPVLASTPKYCTGVARRQAKQRVPREHDVTQSIGCISVLPCLLGDPLGSSLATVTPKAGPPFETITVSAEQNRRRRVRHTRIGKGTLPEQRSGRDINANELRLRQRDELPRSLEIGNNR